MKNGLAQSRHMLKMARAACTAAIEGIDEALAQIDASEKLRSANGQLRTREVVLEYLSTSKGPRTAAEVFDMLQTCGSVVSRDAVYQMLGRLAKRSEIRHVTSGVYEAHRSEEAIATLDPGSG